MNKPYIKQFNQYGEVINQITKEEPYLHQFPNKRQRNMSRGQYQHFQDGSKVKIYGNNRKNTSKRKNKHSRLIH
jgi:hypothetical protein